jgi:hypothetical protein
MPDPNSDEQEVFIVQRRRYVRADLTPGKWRRVACGTFDTQAGAEDQAAAHTPLFPEYEYRIRRFIDAGDQP